MYPFGGGMEMQNIRAIMREGRIELLEALVIPEGTQVIVTPVNDETDFWLSAGERSIASVWDNAEDDVYAKLLEK
jgi:hypothetical protein